jgi:hypothetical protein
VETSMIAPPSDSSKGSDPTAPAQDAVERLRDEAARIAAEHHQRSAARCVADEDVDMDALNRELGDQP